MIETTRRAMLAGGGLALAAPFAAAAQPRRAGGARAATAELARLNRELGIPAVSAAVVRGGRVVWAQASGLADLEQARPASPEDRYRMGSTSKVVTAAILMRLVERGTVALDAPIGRYRPTLPEQHRATTLRQLAAHLGGVRHYGVRDMSWPSIDLRNYRTTDDMLAIFVADPLLKAPGESYNYSTFGFTLIGAVLESASGRSFPQLIQDEVSGPLALRIEAEIPMNLQAGRISPYVPTGSRYTAMEPRLTGKVLNAPPVNPTYKWPGGGMIGRASDLALFGATHLAPGYLKAESLRELMTPLKARDGKVPVPVGVAWRIDSDKQGRRRWHHAGAIDGGRSQLVVYPDAGMAVALMSNLAENPMDPLPSCARIGEAFGLPA
ncbi:serine hydrolase domain-containing protein [Phenylobacterium sp.]|jgi:CubicO group peptidase (beta-lactamase class C family)|uniref:serine hydrolase domain-containing protein n=1 Tax=Phenylobacterium sp. TaxID=1871053 RepID=UPI002F924593